MQPSIPVAAFINPKPGSREHNAILRAIEIQPAVHPIGTFEAAAGREAYFRVRARGRDRHLVIRWFSKLSDEELISCDCPSFFMAVSGPNACYHVGAALIYEATQEAPKLASMGRKDNDEKRRETQIDAEGQAGGKSCNTRRSRNGSGRRDALNHYDGSAVALRKQPQELNRPGKDLSSRKCRG